MQVTRLRLSVYRRIQALNLTHPLPLSQSIQQGLVNSRLLKDSVKRKVAWKQASPRYNPFTELIQHALLQETNQPTRILQILSRMLNEHVRWGHPTGVNQKLLDKLCVQALRWILEDEKGCFEVFECLAQINKGSEDPVWTVTRAVVFDIRGDRKGCQVAIEGIDCQESLLTEILGSKRVSQQFVVDLHERCCKQMSCGLAAAFYFASTDTPVIQKSIAGWHEHIIKKQSKLDRDEGRTVLALTHQNIGTGNKSHIKGLLSRYPALAIEMGWPVNALRIALQILLDSQKEGLARDLIYTTATHDTDRYCQLVGGEQILVGNEEFKLAMLQGELGLQKEFFIPQIQYRWDNPLVQQHIKDHLAQNRGDMAVKEARKWAFRLQSPEPIIAWLQVNPLRECSIHLLESLTRLLCNTSQKVQAGYGHVLDGFAETRGAILSEYVRCGIEPNPEMLALLYGHIRKTDRHKAFELSKRILPQMVIAKASSENERMAIQMFYERLIMDCHSQPRHLLHLLRHLLTTNTKSPAFLQHIVNLSVVTYLRHGLFLGRGFFRLERVLVRFINDEHIFGTQYLNQLRARFWALHMFLRRQGYVPKLHLYRKQLQVHKYRLYKINPTAVLSKKLRKAKGMDEDVMKVKTKIDPKDIQTALNIFLHSIPRNRLGTKKYSVHWEK